MMHNVFHVFHLFFRYLLHGFHSRGWGLLFCIPLMNTGFVKPLSAADDNLSRPIASSVMTQSDEGEVKRASAILAGGCFWCVESDFEKAPGVVEVISGYSGGRTKSPKYTNYASGGHREVVFIVYDPNQITYAGLVEFLLKHVDPTDRTGSFVDKGLQYSPAIYYETTDERQEAQRVVKAIEEMKVFRGRLNIPILPRQTFWPAEEYHQDYHSTNAAKYNLYRANCGRDHFVRSVWGQNADKLTIPGSIPNPQFNPADDPERLDTTSESGDTGNSQPAPWLTFKKPTDQELRRKLSAIQFEVTQRNGTEIAFRNPYWNNHAEGLYVDLVSGEPLFSSIDKFDSGTGWPSFTKPLDAYSLVTRVDTTEDVPRMEVRTRISDSHLGHVFNDGPPDRGGLRYCMNSAALRFIPKNRLDKEGYGQYRALFEESKSNQ
jgi:peptide methionine sulfoxide reductase msrA/msrB